MGLARVLVVVLATALSACVGGGSGGGGGFAPVTLPPSASIDTLINQVRAERGLGALERDSRLDAAAAAHARDLAARNALTHRGSDGSDHVARASRAGYGPFVAENLAAGQKTPAEVMQAWLGSSGHRRNLLLDPARHYGFAHAVAPGTKYGHFWVLQVGREPGGTAAPGGPSLVSWGAGWVGSGIDALGGLVGLE